MSQAKLSNRNRAPFTAETVDVYREVFGDGVKVLYAREGDFETGEKQAEGAPCLTVMVEDDAAGASPGKQAKELQGRDSDSLQGGLLV
jgi:hypothetical protein